MRWVSLVPILLLASTAWRQSTTPERPDAEALLQEAATTCAHLANTSVHVEVVKESTMTNDAEQDSQKTYQTLIRDGGRFRLETRTLFGSSWVQVSDGKTEWIYRVGVESYLQHRAGELKDTEDVFYKPSGAASPSFYKVHFGGSEQLSEAWDTVEFLELKAAKNSDATLLPDETITLNGRNFPCYVVRAYGNSIDSEISLERTFWIDKQTHVFRKIVEHNRTSLRATPSVRVPMIRNITTTYPVFDIDPRMPDSVFQFTPPDGVTLVDDLRPDWLRKLPPIEEKASTKIHREPDIQLTDGAGKTVPLSSYRGKPVLIDLWATWCGPCIASMPTFGKIAKDYRDKGLVVISIDEDKDAQSPLDYLKRHDFAWSNYHDSDDTDLHAFKSHAIPTIVLIDKDGNVVFTDTGDDYESALRAELDKMFPKAQTASKQ